MRIWRVARNTSSLHRPTLKSSASALVYIQFYSDPCVTACVQMSSKINLVVHPFTILSSRGDYESKGDRHSHVLRNIFFNSKPELSLFAPGKPAIGKEVDTCIGVSIASAFEFLSPTESNNICCFNGGTCILGSFCACRPHYKGRYCEYPPARACEGQVPHGSWLWRGCSFCRCVYGEIRCISQLDDYILVMACPQTLHLQWFWLIQEFIQLPE
uniref:EGF-like domain-containing protein n=1 Tax=Eptatretus burgeri TaxID=7764 RepID=A0A8C4QZD9_EPTBU